MGGRRTKSEPVDYDVASEEHDPSARGKSGKKNTAANIAKWLKRKLVVGGTRCSSLTEDTETDKGAPFNRQGTPISSSESP